MSLLGNLGSAAVSLLNTVGQQRQAIAMATKPVPYQRIGSVPLRGNGLVAMPGSGFGKLPSTIGPQSRALGFKKRRRTNPTNVHALRRALRRVEGFVKLEKRVDKIVNRLSRSKGRANRSGFVRKR